MKHPPHIGLAAATLALLGLGALGGCVFVITPNHDTHAEWAGNYARHQATQADRNRRLALAVRKRLGSDPVLAPLKLKFFVHDGEISFCGPFPTPQLRARTFGKIGALKGVTGVDDSCDR